jgi:exodeoxyribonuclease-5
MISDHLISLLRQHLSHQPTHDQELLIGKLARFVTGESHADVMLIRGYAGTGKTSVIAALTAALRSLNIRFVMMAPTGRAAKVLSSYSGHQAFTIHKKIYRQRSSRDIFGKFELNCNVASNTFFIVDEASMISNESAEASAFGSGRLLDDLIRFVYNNRGCKLILSGDTAQLPPVGLDISPALAGGNLSSYGLGVEEQPLTEVVRQSFCSGILHNATRLREMLRDGAPSWPGLTGRMPDVERVAGQDLVERISDAHDRYGLEETIIVCRSNKRANQFNQGIRNRILFRDEILCAGESLMIVRNNYFWAATGDDTDFIANGDIATLRRVKRYEQRYGYTFADVELELPDYGHASVTAKILVDTLSSEGASLSQSEHKNLYEAVLAEYAHIPQKRKRVQAVREDPFFNALQVKYAYAVTCHKAQGGQWKAVFVDQGWFPGETPDKEYYRWLYTAVTRATERLFLVNFSDRFFTEA